jgi:geranylgeranyl diphosphate synthase type I
VTTVHEHYKNIGKKFLKNRDPQHFGNSVGIIIGDMIGALGNKIIYDSEFESRLIVKALARLQHIISYTVIGQTEDIYIENKGKATEKEVLKMYENKTAKYTIEGPLHLGATLAGADEKFLKFFSEYSIPVGIAFQIQDDILGIFGDEKKLGKSVGSDIRQGKQTILVAKAFEKATAEQKKILERTLGKKDLTAKDLKDFRKVIIDTGSLDYVKNLSEKLVSDGKKVIEKASASIKIEKEAKEFILGIADYIISRTV